MISFSPRARGCSDWARSEIEGRAVFPACAGMFLLRSPLRRKLRGFPRVRGDVPLADYQRLRLKKFSPRARGCSRIIFDTRFMLRVFPACAGMFLPPHAPDRPVHRFPRVRGDVPKQLRGSLSHLMFSPRARGCSSRAADTDNNISVFPACAGMFRKHHKNQAKPQGFPRVRGDVPAWMSMNTPMATFSPRARGCSS